MNDTENIFNKESETTVITPAFDLTACERARRVVALPTNVSEEATQIKTKFQTVSNKPLPNIPDKYEKIATARKPKSKSFLKYFLVATFFVFALCAGAVLGFVLAQYQNATEEKPGLAFVPHPALKDPKGMPKLELEVFEDPDEEDSDEEADNDPVIEYPYPDSHSIEPTPPNPERTPSSLPQNERRERKIEKPTQPVVKNRKPKQQTTEEYTLEQLRKIREQLEKILN